MGLGGEHGTLAARGKKINIAGRSDRVLVVAVAGVRKGRISKRKNHAAMTDVVAIDHIAADLHRQHCDAGAYRLNLNAKRLGGPIP